MQVVASAIRVFCFLFLVISCFVLGDKPLPKYDLSECQKYEDCECKVDKKAGTITPCPSLDVFSARPTHYGGITGKTDEILILTGEEIQQLPKFSLYEADVKGVNIFDVWRLSTIDEPFFALKSNFISMKVGFEGGLRILQDSTFLGWNTSTLDETCGDFKGFDQLDGSCYTLEISVSDRGEIYSELMEIDGQIFGQLGFLQALKLHGPMGVQIGVLRGLKNVKHVSISGNVIRQFVPHSFKDMVNLESFEIEMDHWPSEGDVTRNFADWFSGKPKLRKIAVKGAMVGDFGFFLSKLNNTASIRELAITRSTLRGGIDRNLVNLTNLEVLDLSGSNIEQWQVDNFTETRRPAKILPKLREIRLSEGIRWNCGLDVCASGPFRNTTVDDNVVFTARKTPEPQDNSGNSVVLGTLFAVLLASLIVL